MEWVQRTSEFAFLIGTITVVISLLLAFAAGAQRRYDRLYGPLFGVGIGFLILLALIWQRLVYVTRMLGE